MADVTMELNGKRKRVPADMVDHYTGLGAKVVEIGPMMAPTPAMAAPTVAMPSAGSAPSSPTRTISDAAKAFATGASRWGTLGLDDTMSGLLTGALEAASPTSLSDEGDDVLTRMQKGYSAGQADRRAMVEDLSQRSPKAYGAGSVAGVLATLPLAPESIAARRALAAVGGLGLSDADPLSLEGAGQAALGVVGGEVAGKVAGKLAPIVAPIVARQVARIGSAKDMTQAAARKSADALKSLLGKVDESPAMRDVVGGLSGGTSNLVTGTARTAERVLRAAGGKPAPAPVAAVEEATVAPAAELTPDDLVQILANLKRGNPPAAPMAAPVPRVAPPTPVAAAPVPVVVPAPSIAPAPVAAPVAAPAARPGPSLRMDFEAPASPDVPAPVAVKAPDPGASMPGGIYIAPLAGVEKEIFDTAMRLGTSEITTIANAMKMQPGQIESRWANVLRQFKYRDAINKAAAAKAPTPATGPTAAALDELAAEGAAAAPMAPPMRQAGDLMPPEAMESIRMAKVDTPKVLGFMDRPGNQVAAANQGAQMRQAYANLTPPQRLQYIQQLRGSGVPEDTIRRRLGIGQKAWTQLSFAPRAGPRAPSKSEGPLKPKTTGGEGEGEDLLPSEAEDMLARAADAVRVHAPWALENLGKVPLAQVERLAQIAAGNLPKSPIPGVDAAFWTRQTLAKAGLRNPAEIAFEAEAAARVAADAAAKAAKPPPPPPPPPKGKVFYHTTSAADLGSIIEEGLVPQARPSKFGGAYDRNSAGRTFLAGDKEAARTWAAKVEDALFASSDDVERQAPVALRVRFSGKPKVDTMGSADVPGSYFTDRTIPPENIEFFDGAAGTWRPLRQWAGFDEASSYVPTGAFPDDAPAAVDSLGAIVAKGKGR